MSIEFVEQHRKVIEPFLEQNLPNNNKVCEAMRYSILNGGKRIRPAIMMEFFRICGGTGNAVLYFAAALECIHTYSLIHDDLPCMDNDDLRRGKPSCHMAYGEARALLAGDGLLTFAFELCSKAKDIDSDRAVNAIGLLAKYSGISGMIDGQELDLQGEGITMSLEQIKKMYLQKTGALIKAAAEIGCVLAGANAQKLSAARIFADNFGMCFQITDDILDVTGSTQSIGKPVGSDKKNEKATYISAVGGVDEGKAVCLMLAQKAKSALDAFGADADGLRDLADYLINRKN